MPFKSLSQRKLFYHLKSKGKMDQKTIDEWESETPEHIPERLHKKGEAMLNKDFWNGFYKRAADAAETYVSANPAMEAPGAPEKALKWNDHGGVDPRTPEELQAAQAVALKTLPPEVHGACCGSCMHFRGLTEALGHGFCTNPEVKMDVTENMHCANWNHPDAHDPVAAAEEEAQQQEVEMAQAAQQQQQMSQVAGAGGQPQPQQQQQPQPQGGQAGPGPKGSGAGAAPAPSGQAAAGGEMAQSADGMPAETNAPSAVGTQSGFPEGAQTSANPLVEQAVNDFQGQGATAGPTGAGASGGESSPSKKPSSKKSSGSGKKTSDSSKKTSDSDSSKKSSDSEKKNSKGHTFNINVGGEEKTAGADYWKGVVPGY